MQMQLRCGLLFLVWCAGLGAQPTTVAPTTRPGSSAAALETRKLALALAEKFLLLLRNRKSLGSGAAPLDDTKRAEIRRSLMRLNVQGFPPAVAADVQQLKGAMLDYLARPSGSEINAYVYPLLLAVLVDFDVDRTFLTRVPDHDLAEGVEEILDLGKTTTLLTWQVNVKNAARVLPATRYFVEYFAICNALGDDKRRPVRAQAALLSMNPAEITDRLARSTYVTIHSRLRELSLTASSPSPTSFASTLAYCTATFVPLYASKNVDKVGIKQYAGDGLVKILDSMTTLTHN